MDELSLFGAIAITGFIGAIIYIKAVIKVGELIAQAYLRKKKRGYNDGHNAANQ